MLRILVRIAGVLLLAGGFAALVADGARSLAGGSLYVTTLAGILQATRPEVRQELEVSLGSVGSSTLFYLFTVMPFSLALCAAGGALFVVSHKERGELGSLPEYSG